MSAADVPPAGRDELRDAMAAALQPVAQLGIRPDELADALLPAVTAWADRRAATELRAAAQDWELRGLTLTANELYARADTLSAPSAPPGVLDHLSVGDDKRDADLR